jgi:YHS domain-containing protein
MINRSRFVALLTVLAFVSVLAAAAVQEKNEELVKDPVCGMAFKKAEAKATFDYKGTTYYFCNQGCKDKFAQDPEKYLLKKEEKTEKAEKCEKAEKAEKAAHGCPMMQGKMHMMEGQPGEGKGEACCPMAGLRQGKDTEFKVENTKDGIQITISSKDAAVVKKIQEMAAKMKAGCDPKTCAKEQPGK